MVNFFKRGVIYLIFVISSTVMVMASVPNPIGDYIGVTLNSDNESVRINFTDNSDNEDGFKLIVNGEVNKTMPPNIEYTDLGNLECNQTYSLQILAFNDEGNSSISNTRSFNLHSTFGVDCGVPISTIPNAPGAYIGVTGIDSNSVRINFKDNSDNETGFRVYSLSGDINETISANDETVNSQVYKTLNNLICNKVYQIQAVAFNGNGNSTPSNTKAFRIESTFGIPCSANNAPIADAGDDQTLALENNGTVVHLDGSSSSDADGDTLTYSWSFISEPAGSTAILDNFASINPSFTTTIAGDYTLQLIVNDGQANSVADSVTISVVDNNNTSSIPPALDPTTIPATIFD